MNAPDGAGPRRLILMRHAKSSWDDPALADHARPLARRGRLAAPLMGAYLAEVAAEDGFLIDHVWLSDSVRTQQTYERLRPLLAAAPAPTLSSRLYTEDPADIGAVAAQTPPEAQAALVIGHHPSLDGFAGALVPNAPARFPTAAVAVLSLSGPWSALAAPSRRDATLLRFEAPKTLV